MRTLTIHTLILFALTLFGLPEGSHAASAVQCLKASGNATASCLRKYSNKVDACRKKRDAACEVALRVGGGELDSIVAKLSDTVAKRCNETTAADNEYLGIDDLQRITTEACVDYAEDYLGNAYSELPNNLISPPAFVCQKTVANAVGRLRNRVVASHGVGCIVKNAAGRGCDRGKREDTMGRVRDAQAKKILKKCDLLFDVLDLSTLDPNSSTLEERIDELLERTETRARHFAQLVYPPNDQGPGAALGAFEIGVTTLQLSDANRLNVPGNGPRPVTVEIFYPSTAAAVEGVPNDIVTLLGIEITETPAFRDVAIAPGTFPLILFSHGNNGIRFQSFAFAAHLANHGFIVVAPDHHGNTFIDTLAGVFDANVVVNRPLDMSFVLDSFLAFNQEGGNFFEDTIDPNKIGMSGHSFGGYTTFALAGGPFIAGTFTDPRIKAFVPLAPASAFFDNAFFQAITAPMMIIGATLDETTPFEANQQVPFDNLPSGAAVVALAEILDGGHFTFSDFCEVDRVLLGFLGGFDEACEPRHLPWRHARDIINLLSLSFFDGILNGNAAALDRLDPANLALIEDLAYQSK